MSQGIQSKSVELVVGGLAALYCAALNVSCGGLSPRSSKILDSAEWKIPKALRTTVLCGNDHANPMRGARPPSQMPLLRVVVLPPRIPHPSFPWQIEIADATAGGRREFIAQTNIQRKVRNECANRPVRIPLDPNISSGNFPAESPVPCNLRSRS